jgi:hypothetical protein
MAALDFPSSPSNGQQFSGPGGVTWVYDLAGTKWVAATLAGGVFAPLVSPPLTGNPTAPTPAAGDADTSIATTAFVGAAVTAGAATNVGRNLIHNSMFNVAQRGVGVFNTTGTWTLDRWRIDFGLDTFSLSQVSYVGVLPDEEAANCMAVTVTGNAGPTAFSLVSQNIENVRRLAGKTITVSFWANSTSGTPKVGVGFRQSFGTGGTPHAVVDINATPVTLSTVATRYSVTVTLPSIAGFTVGTDPNTSFTRLGFFFSAGANTNTIAGGIGVQTGPFTFVLWGVQFEIGAVATPLEKRDPVDELQQCQRFYQTGTAGLESYNTAGAGIGYRHAFAVTMRAVPTTVALSAPSYVNASGATTVSVTFDSFEFKATVTATGAAVANAAYTASADL